MGQATTKGATKDEIWVTRDGRKIAVCDMGENHVRNALRMLIRNHRCRLARAAKAELDDLAIPELTVGDMQDMLNGEHYRNLADPRVYFPTAAPMVVRHSRPNTGDGCERLCRSC